MKYTYMKLKCKDHYILEMTIKNHFNFLFVRTCLIHILQIHNTIFFSIFLFYKKLTLQYDI